MIISKRNASTNSPICHGPVTPTQEVSDIHENSKIPAPPVVIGSRKWKASSKNSSETVKLSSNLNSHFVINTEQRTGSGS